ncbi:MAG TPA: winged helix-turn-helix domain-containing protein, partial [Solirubrobacteraceae bacterium]
MDGQNMRIRLCGRLEVEWRGESVEGALRGRQGRLLLAFLVLHRDRAVSRDALVAAVWPQEARSGVESHLAPLLSRLRKALGPEHVQGRSEIQLVLPGDAEVDVERARADLAAARAALVAGDTATARTAAAA